MKGSRTAGGVEVGGVRVPINIKGRSLCAGLTLEGSGGGAARTDRQRWRSGVKREGEREREKEKAREREQQRQFVTKAAAPLSEEDLN